MPIYEFYCSACHTLFNFYSPRVDTGSQPSCPRCGRVGLERRPARFALLRHAGRGEEDPLNEIDESRRGGVMQAMMAEMEQGADGEDPRRLARMFRRLAEGSGLEAGPKLEELLVRLEAGEDPDALDAEMEDDLEGDESLRDFFQVKRRLREGPPRRLRVDDTLYFL